MKANHGNQATDSQCGKTAHDCELVVRESRSEVHGKLLMFVYGCTRAAYEELWTELARANHAAIQNVLSGHKSA